MPTRLSAILCVVVMGCGDGSEKAPAESPGNCSGENMHVNRGNPLECCQKGDEIWQTLDRKRLAYRKIGPACRGADGIDTQCGSLEDPVPCFYGPCGTAVPEVKMGTLVTIFHPRSDPSVCGWDIDGTDVMPEKYDNQEVYPGVVATCRFTTCKFPGIPTTVEYALSVEAIGEAATGTLVSTPDGISLAGAGDASAQFLEEMVVTLTATPKGASARAVLSDACSVTGNYGEAASCTVAMDAAHLVTVTYQCEPGSTCEP